MTELLTQLPYWAYKQISSGPLLSMLSQYRERSGERAESGVVKPPLVSVHKRTSGRDSVPRSSRSLRLANAAGAAARGWRHARITEQAWLCPPWLSSGEALRRLDVVRGRKRQPDQVDDPAARCCALGLTMPAREHNPQGAHRALTRKNHRQLLEFDTGRGTRS